MDKELNDLLDELVGNLQLLKKELFEVRELLRVTLAADWEEGDGRRVARASVEAVHRMLCESPPKAPKARWGAALAEIADTEIVDRLGKMGTGRFQDILDRAKRLRGADSEQNYRGYLIYHQPPPIPNRNFDWHYVHEDYSGSEDDRHGSCRSAHACRAEIDERVA